MTHGRRLIGVAVASLVGALAFATAGQDPPPAGPGAAGSAKAQGKKGTKPSPAGALPKKGLPQDRDLAAPGPNQPASKVRFKIASFDASPLAATYYPSRLGPTAAVILIVHEQGQTSRDYENPIEDQKGRGLAEILQRQGYAVVLFDLRGTGGSRGAPLGPADLLQPNPDPAKPQPAPKGAAAPKTKPAPKAKGKAQDDEDDDPAAKARALRDLQRKAADLQAVFTFMLNRHNRGEFNVAKLGILAAGDGANLAVLWAATPGSATASPRPLSDLAALALVSPDEALDEVPITKGLKVVGGRIPCLIVAGGDDEASRKVAQSERSTVERHRHGRVELRPESKLRGSRLIRFEPGVAQEIIRFFDTTIKFKSDAWEPRFVLTPVATTRGEVVALPKADAKEEPDAEKK